MLKVDNFNLKIIKIIRNMNLSFAGRWAFLIGLILAILAGFGGVIPNLVFVLFILGLVVGFLNVAERESTPFLVAVIALVLIGVAGLQLGQLTGLFAGILNNLVAFASAAALVVAVKQILAIAKNTQ